MSIVHNFRKRKATGGRYKDVKTKRLAQRGNLASLTKLDNIRVQKKRTMGNNRKVSMMSGNKVNVVDPKSKKSSVTEIKSVLENTASRHFVRRNIITKGAIIETGKGKARVTSRPGQDGIINAVLVKE